MQWFQSISIIVINIAKGGDDDDDDDDDYDDDDDDDQVRAGAGVAAPPGAVSAGTGKGLVCRLVIFDTSIILIKSIVGNVTKIITDGKLI